MVSWLGCQIAESLPEAAIKPELVAPGGITASRRGSRGAVLGHAAGATELAHCFDRAVPLGVEPVELGPAGGTIVVADEQADHSHFWDRVERGVELPMSRRRFDTRPAMPDDRVLVVDRPGRLDFVPKVFQGRLRPFGINAMNRFSTTRRQLLQAALPAALGFSGVGRRGFGRVDLPPSRAITKGPKFHWFGYYDKLEFDPTGRFVLGMAVDFEGRTPRPDDVIEIGMVDLHDGDRWIELGRSTAWCWQQGCMLQWLPGSRTEVLWNDREGGRYVCRILDVESRAVRTVDEPIYAVVPGGELAVAADFRRLQDVRPGYGYAGIPDPSDASAPTDSGLWKVDLKTGSRDLLLSVAEVARLGDPPDAKGSAKHWLNHLLPSPDGSRVAFLHRWRPESGGGFLTRMITVGLDGKNPYVLDPSGSTSHFIWRAPRQILAWTQPDGEPAGFYRFRDRSGDVEPVGRGVMVENGHCTYLPGGEWILNDTYPDADRLQHVYLYHIETRRRVPLGDFRSPKDYSGEWRCDTHPRSSPDGTKVVIDSPHGGGRQLHLIDVAAIVGE